MDFFYNRFWLLDLTQELGLAVCRAAEERELFQGRVPEGLSKMETFPTKFMGIAAQDDTEDLSRTAGVLQQAFGMEAESITPQDRREVSSVELPILGCASTCTHHCTRLPSRKL